MQETLQEILDLQRHYSSADTLEMRLRGKLVRDRLCSEITRVASNIGNALGQYGTDLAVQGSDGAGRKAIVPWTRIFSKHMSPSATVGWYLVFLFHPDGDGVSLCLSHGSTIPKDGNFKSRSRAEAEHLMEWASAVVGADFASDMEVRRGVELGSQRLAAAYERTTLLSRFYPRFAIPKDDVLLDDIVAFAAMLARLYAAQDAGLTPGASSPAVTEVLQVSEGLAAPFKFAGRGQGWGLDHAGRIAVEHQAMKIAETWLAEQMFAYQDVSSTDSCDFRASRDGEQWVIEVKGTTGSAGSVLVTRNEVALHKACHPKNALLIVHSIELSADGRSATGGKLRAICPWKVDDDRLHPTAYEYRLE
ncbi:MrcB family domain-containing protein [Brevundimonas poindexterae]|uniref:MrcB family domain-containing protein n=1 Tax=Brevundimonas poindexterae TaxID=74325 RepID=UPI001CFE7577|nr:DUF3578 domain-containing protein [Brevundimonas poindexterae]